MITIPRRSSDCQIAISTDNRQVTKCCHGTKTTDGKIQWVRMRCWTLVFVGEYLYVSVQRIEREYYVSYCQTAHHNHRGILKGFCSCHSYDNKRINAKKARMKLRGRKTWLPILSIWCWTLLEKPAITHASKGWWLEFCASMILSWSLKKKNVGLQFRTIR